MGILILYGNLFRNFSILIIFSDKNKKIIKFVSLKIIHSNKFEFIEMNSSKFQNQSVLFDKSSVIFVLSVYLLSGRL